MGFGQGLSGLNAAAQNLDVIGNNIANSATVGFKSSSVSFADVYANSRVGLGVAVAAVAQRFALGTVKASGGEFDIAIDGSKGMFRLQDQSGQTVYSRNGEFSADKNNFIVNAQGQRLTGFVGGANSTMLGPLVVPTGNIAPAATSGIEVKANLDANSPIIREQAVPESLGSVTLTSADNNLNVTRVYFKESSSGTMSWFDVSGNPAPAPANGTYTSGANVSVTFSGGQIVAGNVDKNAPNSGYVAPQNGHPFSPTDPKSFTHSLPIRTYDSLGNSHQLTQYFVKREGSVGTQSHWDVHYRFDGLPTDAPAGGGPVSMTFDGAGRLLTHPVSTVVVKSPGFAGAPAEPLAITVDRTGSTQYGGDFTPSFVQNGYATGEYVGLNISKTGEVVANYTNGKSDVVGVIALADFKNLQGLTPLGGNAWAESPESGEPIVGRAGANGMAMLRGQALEASNVDMGEELVNMIVAQRNYQANAQTIKTQDQVLQTLVSMR